MVILKEYDSDDRRLEVQTRLDILQLPFIIKEYAITDERIGIQKLISLIDCLTHQAQPTFRNDE